MNKKMRIALKLIPLIELCLVFLLAGVIYILAKLWAGRYIRVYENSKITMRTLHEKVITPLIGVLFYLIVASCIVITILCIVERIRHDEDTAGLYVRMWIISGISAAILFVGAVLVESSSDTDPKCFEFSDAQHTVVIEEESWLLGGWGNIYQVNDDGSAQRLSRFSTDDGFRNEGNYDINWHDDSADITYGNGNGGRETVTVKFEK